MYKVPNHIYIIFVAVWTELICLISIHFFQHVLKVRAFVAQSEVLCVIVLAVAGALVSTRVSLYRAKEMLCNNALYPDLYGHYREAKFTQTKHHWWWKANRVFNQLEVTRNHTGTMAVEGLTVAMLLLRIQE